MLGLLQRHQAWCEHSVKWLLAQFRVAICFNEVKARLRQTELGGYIQVDSFSQEKSNRGVVFGFGVKMGSIEHLKRGKSRQS